VLADLDYIDHHPLQFDMDPAGWQQHLHDLRQSAEAGQDQLAAAAADCRNDLTHCGVPNVVDPGSLRDQYPLRYSGTCDTVNFTPQPLAVFPLGQHVRGDKDIDGHDPEIRVSAQTQVDQQGYVINATARVSIQEDQPDYTTFEDEMVGQLLDLRFVQLHCFVDSNGVNPSTGELVARGQNDNHNWTVYGPGQGSTGDTGTGLLEAAECISDTNGNDDGKLGCRNIVLRPVQLSLRHDEKRMDDTIRRFTLSQRRQAAENISSNAEGNAAAAYGRLLDSAIKAAEAQGASQLLSWLRTQTRGGPITNSGQPRIPVPMTPRSDRPARLLHQ
jgi:hypothetical protein